MAAPAKGEALLAQALALLRSLGYECEERVSLDVTPSGVCLRIRAREARKGSDMNDHPEDRPDDTPPAAWLWLSPLERQVVGALRAAPAAWTTGEQLARACDVAYSSDFRVILRNLTARGILQSSQGHGYRLDLPAC